MRSCPTCGQTMHCTESRPANGQRVRRYVCTEHGPAYTVAYEQPGGRVVEEPLASERGQAVLRLLRQARG